MVMSLSWAKASEYEGAYKVTQGLRAKFGGKADRHADYRTRYCRSRVGAAFAGLKPVVEFMTLISPCRRLTKSSIVRPRRAICRVVSFLPDCVSRPNGYGVARCRAAQPRLFQLVCACAWAGGIDPADAMEAKGLLKAAIRDPNPVVFLEHELLYGDIGHVPDYDDFVLPIGRARIVRPGNDVTLVAYARGVALALQAAEQLAAIGLEAEVIDLRSLRRSIWTR